MLAFADTCRKAVVTFCGTLSKELSRAAEHRKDEQSAASLETLHSLLNCLRVLQDSANPFHQNKHNRHCFHQNLSLPMFVLGTIYAATRLLKDPARMKEYNKRLDALLSAHDGVLIVNALRFLRACPDMSILSCIVTDVLTAILKREDLWPGSAKLLAKSAARQARRWAAYDPLLRSVAWKLCHCNWSYVPGLLFTAKEMLLTRACELSLLFYPALEGRLGLEWGSARHRHALRSSHSWFGDAQPGALVRPGILSAECLPGKKSCPRTTPACQKV